MGKTRNWKEKVIALLELLEEIEQTPTILKPSTPKMDKITWQTMQKKARGRHEILKL